MIEPEPSDFPSSTDAPDLSPEEDHLDSIPESRWSTLLRDVEPPKVPPDLLDRLLTDLPSDVSTNSSEDVPTPSTFEGSLAAKWLRPRRIAAGSVAAMVVSLLLSFVWIDGHESLVAPSAKDIKTDHPNPGDISSEFSPRTSFQQVDSSHERTSARTVQYSIETDPCFILPTSTEL